MKKSDIAAHVAGKTSLATDHAEPGLSVVLRTIMDALARGESVSIATFGTFSVTVRVARVPRGPERRSSKP